jgi:hypothetical protein
MKPIFLSFFLIFTLSQGQAQTIKVKSFRAEPNDLTARVTAPVKDQNGEYCALIKVRTTLKDFHFDGDMNGLFKIKQDVGEIWIYLPQKSRRLSIKHADYGVIANYIYPESITEASVYIMELKLIEAKTPPKEIEEIPIQAESPVSIPEDIVFPKIDPSDTNLDSKKRVNFFLTTNSSVFAPYGIRMGLLARTGFYLAANFSEKSGDWGSMTKAKFEYTLEEDASTLSDFDDSDGLYYKSTDEKAQVFNYAISIGLTSDLGNHWFMYYGLGYGVHHKLYNFESYYSDTTFRANILVKDDESSTEGAVFEAGFIVKVKPFALTAGWSTIQFDRHEVKFGVGFYF